MWTSTIEGKKLVSELANEIVAGLAPEELPLFDELLEEFFAELEPTRSKRHDDDLLGFGLPESLKAVTPAAAAALIAVLNFLLVETIRVAQSDAAKDVKNKLQTIFSPKNEKVSDRAITEDQLDVVKKRSYEIGLEFGMDSEKAGHLADAVVSVLH